MKKEVPVNIARPRDRASLVKSPAHAELRNTLVGLLYNELVEQSAMSAAL